MNDFINISGDKRFAEDESVIAGFARLEGCLLYTSDAADE